MFNCSNVLLFYCSIVLLFYCSIVLLFYCSTVLLFYCCSLKDSYLHPVIKYTLFFGVVNSHRLTIGIAFWFQ